MPTNGMTIDSLNTVSFLTAQDEVPVWDKEASSEPTRKITAQNMANSVKSLASLPNITEMNTAIEQSTAVVDITQSYTCQSTSFEYTGASIEIPAHACYGLMGTIVFANALPQGAAFSFSSTDMASHNAVGVAEVGNTCVCGYNNSANSITLYLWGKWSGPSTNMAYIRGWIR